MKTWDVACARGTAHLRLRSGMLVQMMLYSSGSFWRR